MGQPWMTCHTWSPHTKLSLILEIFKKKLDCSYFAKIMTRKPKIGNLTNMTELCPFLESKKKILWSLDLLVKTINTKCRCKFLDWDKNKRINELD